MIIISVCFDLQSGKQGHLCSSLRLHASDQVAINPSGIRGKRFIHSLSTPYGVELKGAVVLTEHAHAPFNHIQDE